MNLKRENNWRWWIEGKCSLLAQAENESLFRNTGSWSGFFFPIDDYLHDKSITLPSQTSMICFVFFPSCQGNSWHNVTLLENVYVSGNYWNMMLLLISILCRMVVIRKLDIDMQESAGVSQLISPSCSRHFSVRRHRTIASCMRLF